MQPFEAKGLSLHMSWPDTGASVASSIVERTGGVIVCGLPLKIYYLHPRLAGPLVNWPRHLERARNLGFDHLCIAPVFAPGAFGDVFLAADFEAAAPILSFVGPVDQAVAEIAALCRRYDLALLLDLVLDRLAIDSPALRRPGVPFGDQPPDRTVIDPRLPPAEVHTAFARLDDPASIAALTSWWADRLTRLIGSGAAGFRLLNLDRVPGRLLTNLVTRVRQQAGSGCFLGWTPGVPWDRLSRLAGAGLDGVFASTPWWDGRASWYLEEHEMLRRVAPVIGVAEAPFADRLAQRGSTLCRRSLKIAAATGDGVLVPMGFEFLSRRPMDPRFSTPEDLVEAEQEAGAGLVKDITAANALVDRLAASGLDGEIRSLTGPGSRVAALQRGKRAVILINSDLTDARPLPIDFDAEDVEDVNGDALAAGEVRVAFPRPQPEIVDYGQPLGSAMKAPRIVIDKVTPRVEGGSFAAKRIVGQTITVEADVFIDGHDTCSLPLSFVRHTVGYAQQDAFLFSTTVARNIGFSLDEPDSPEGMDLVRDAAREAQVLEEALSLPEQFDTVVGERGVQLSGGQKQRVALARALAWGPHILVLDDPLSAVDAKTEAAILQAIERQAQKRTVVLITHRVAAAARCDAIVVLDQGRVVERGTHDELLRAQGIYAAFAEEQQMAHELDELDVDSGSLTPSSAEVA